MTSSTLKQATTLPETSGYLNLKYNSKGLIPAIVCDARDNTLLMFGYMNAEAFGLTRQTGVVHFWSRSKGRIWKKGETSGDTLTLIELRVDCDQDALQIYAVPNHSGNTCHTHRRSCFYRRVNGNRLEFLDG
jgi:phosphoribosyl-AMP cyclohydrolase